MDDLDKKITTGDSLVESRTLESTIDDTVTPDELAVHILGDADQNLVRAEVLLDDTALLRRQIAQTARGYVGSREFQQEETLDGTLACALVTSTILQDVKLFDRNFILVDQVEAELLSKGWIIIDDKPQTGDIIIWKGRKTVDVDGRVRRHRHVGVALGRMRAVSNNSDARTPIVHRIDKFPVDRIYRSPEKKEAQYQKEESVALNNVVKQPPS